MNKRLSTALARAIKRRDGYMSDARHARAQERALLAIGLFRTDARPVSFYVMRAREAQRIVRFELAWARENGRAAA
jgi:hypothetical protein